MYMFGPKLLVTGFFSLLQYFRHMKSTVPTLLRYSWTFSRRSTKCGMKGLLLKLKKILPHIYYSILKSYLIDRLFMIKYLDHITATFSIEAGIPQGSALKPLLFTIYTADLPTLTEIIAATFASDIALLASHSDPIIASSTFQQGLDSMEK